MIAKRALPYFVVLAIIGLSIFVILRLREPTPAEILKAEQEVYSVLLLEQRTAYNIAPDKFQIVEYTNSGELQGNTPGDSAGFNIGFDINEFPGLQQETWSDFQEKNKASYPIKDYLPSNSDIILINPENSEQLNWWISFSRIGFNSSLTQAIVLVGDCRGESCYDSTSVSMYSQGYYAFLQKKNNEWIIQTARRAWLIEAPSP